MKLKYKQKLFLWFGIIFLLFTVGIATFEQSRSKHDKREALEEKLDAYTSVIHKTVELGNPLDSLLQLLPSNIRITLIDTKGVVFYDNIFREIEKFENHSDRQELLAAKKTGKGSFVRTSATNGIEYLYYAQSFEKYYVRVALPYDIQVKHFLRANNGYLYLIILLFFVGLLFISITSNVLGESISRLRDFSVAAQENRLDDTNVVFPDDELGQIGGRIVSGYRELESIRQRIAQEREKLLQHIHSSEEGVCFYTSQRKVEFYNGLFMQYINILSDKTVAEPDKTFDSPLFSEINRFLSSSEEENYHETIIKKQGKQFSVQTNIFADKSFEVIIRDITKQEKTRRLKQEMTCNIAHELRTPVTGIRGYLETIIEQPLDAEQQRHFITKAFTQTLLLSELISDMGLLTKIEEAPNSFRMEGVNIPDLVHKVCEDLEIPLKEHNISVEVNMPADTTVKGNENLLYSIFRNLTDNVVKYAGKGTSTSIGLYNSDNDFYYFSFSDNGVGIKDEQHLSRIFERFYRITEGRTRDTGGSGLGLSIVRNAVAFHKGNISVKNRTNGGLEFLFKLPRMKRV